MVALKIENLEKFYLNGTHALKGIDLTVARGDFFALLGPNGAGKSTLIGIVCSLVHKSKGSVKLFSFDLDLERDRAKALIGLVPQEFNFNIFEKVLDIVLSQAGYYGIPRKKALGRAEFYLRKLGLWEKRNDAARTLSGGMKRRLMIARGMIHDPPLLILDEPTAGVDIELRRGMWDFLTEMNQGGTTIILTTHYLEEAEHLCKNVAIIHHGSLMHQDNMQHLIQKLETEIIILDLSSKLEKPPVLEGFSVRLLDEFRIEVQFSQTSTLNALFSQLSAQSIFVKSLRNKTNRLEELFLRLTS